MSLAVSSTFVKQKPKDPFDDKSEVQEKVDKTTIKFHLLKSIVKTILIV